ncbi:uncharacterized protein METZ01_LOCUS424454 [marine metagenome]|uniref:Uncharacterized protein n=1 Tax=marine metagenome TaxID=408172 RepID=A0A382XL76_9ZZZZ
MVSVMTDDQAHTQPAQSREQISRCSRSPLGAI